MSFKILATIFSVSTTPSINALPAEDTSQLTPSERKELFQKFNTWCKQSADVEQSLYFPDVRTKAIKIREDFCANKIPNETILKNSIVDLLNSLNQYLPASPIPAFLHTAEQKLILRGKNISTLQIKTAQGVAIEMESSGLKLVDGETLRQCNTKASSINNGSCFDVLNDFTRLYNFAHGTSSQPYVFELVTYLNKLEQRWNTFYEESKSQTIWELSLNGEMFQRENDADEFAQPPNWQLIVFHPTVVIENVQNAIDGDQLKEALMIELIGADWWEQQHWYLPSGGSLVTTYTDRNDIDDWGYGLALNFDSKFTLGVADHGSDMGIFVTIDLLKLLQNKNTTIEKFRKLKE